MNTVVLSDNIRMPSFNLGSIWENRADSELFILSRTESPTHPFIAISLKDGNRWRDSRATAEAAVSGLELKFENAKITVEAA